MNDKITVVVSSREDYNEDRLKQLIAGCGVETDIIFVKNDNKFNLTAVYNHGLDKAATDIVIFMHDDIQFLKENWGRDIIKLFNENQDYGIIGVAGSAYFDKKGSWWDYTDDRYGQVMHRQGLRSWVSHYSDLLGDKLQEVCVIDGLFMAVNRNRITKRFDENLNGFHFYDIDFCLSNFLDKKTKIGVTTLIRIVHKSMGNTPIEWRLNLDYVNQKYKDFYPIKVKKYNRKK